MSRRPSPRPSLSSECCKVCRSLGKAWATFGERDVGVGWEVLVYDLGVLDYLGLFVLDVLEFLADNEKVIEESDAGLEGRVVLPLLLEDGQVPVDFDIGALDFVDLSLRRLLALVVPNDLLDVLILLDGILLEVLEVEVKTGHADVLVVLVHGLDEPAVVLNNGLQHLYLCLFDVSLEGTHVVVV